MFSFATAKLTPDLVNKFDSRTLASEFIRVEQECCVKFNRENGTFSITGEWGAINKAHELLLSLISKDGPACKKNGNMARIKRKLSTTEHPDSCTAIDKCEKLPSSCVAEKTCSVKEKLYQTKGNPKRGRYLPKQKTGLVPEPGFFLQYGNEAYSKPEELDMDVVLENFEKTKAIKRVSKEDLRKVLKKNIGQMGRPLNNGVPKGATVSNKNVKVKVESKTVPVPAGREVVDLQSEIQTTSASEDLQMLDGGNIHTVSGVKNLEKDGTNVEHTVNEPSKFDAVISNVDTLSHLEDLFPFSERENLSEVTKAISQDEMGLTCTNKSDQRPAAVCSENNITELLGGSSETNEQNLDVTGTRHLLNDTRINQAQQEQVCTFVNQKPMVCNLQDNTVSRTTLSSVKDKIEMSGQEAEQKSSSLEIDLEPFQGSNSGQVEGSYKTEVVTAGEHATEESALKGQARTEGDCGPCQKAEQCSNHDMVNTSLSGIPPLRDKTSENTTGSYESRKLTVETKDAQINVKKTRKSKQQASEQQNKKRKTAPDAVARPIKKHLPRVNRADNQTKMTRVKTRRKESNRGSSAVQEIEASDINNSVSDCTTMGSDTPTVETEVEVEEQKLYKCTECDYTGNKKSRLTDHMGRVHGLLTSHCRSTVEKTAFECDECDKTFVFGKDLNRHKKIVHHMDRFTCEVCEKVYKSLYVFKKHQLTHKEGYVQPMFKCELCEREFTTKYSLSNHIKSHHLEVQKTYSCPLCGKTFCQKRSYRQHANVHAGIKPYKCEICGKSFTYDKSLKEHRYMHDTVRLFSCEICGKAFRQRTCLLIHKKVHSDVKNYICRFCARGFTQKQSLVRHERIHTGVRPYKCTLCNKTYNDHGIIRRHLLMAHKVDKDQWKENVTKEPEEPSKHYIPGGPGYQPRQSSKVIPEMVDTMNKTPNVSDEVTAVPGEVVRSNKPMDVLNDNCVGGSQYKSVSLFVESSEKCGIVAERYDHTGEHMSVKLEYSKSAELPVTAGHTKVSSRLAFNNNSLQTGMEQSSAPVTCNMTNDPDLQTFALLPVTGTGLPGTGVEAPVTGVETPITESENLLYTNLYPDFPEELVADSLPKSSLKPDGNDVDQSKYAYIEFMSSDKTQGHCEEKLYSNSPTVSMASASTEFVPGTSSDMTSPWIVPSYTDGLYNTPAFSQYQHVSQSHQEL